MVSPLKMPSISLPPLVRRKILGSGQGGVWLSSRATARGLKISMMKLDPYLNVESATDGYEGLMKIGKSVPDLLIIDLNMPKINGFEVIRQVKESEEYSSAKIMVVSSALDDEAESKLKESGVSTYLRKPFKLTELKEEVTKLLGLNGSQG